MLRLKSHEAHKGPFQPGLGAVGQRVSRRGETIKHIHLFPHTRRQSLMRRPAAIGSVPTASKYAHSSPCLPWVVYLLLHFLVCIHKAHARDIINDPSVALRSGFHKQNCPESPFFVGLLHLMLEFRPPPHPIIRALFRLLPSNQSSCIDLRLLQEAGWK